MSDPVFNPMNGVSQDERTIAIIACVLAVFSLWVGPLVIWLVKRDQSRFVSFFALQALLVYVAVFGLYCVPVLNFLLGPAAHVVSLVFMILAALAANRGELYLTPVIGRFARQQAGL